MIVITVSLWPGGDPKKSVEIANPTIANTSGFSDVADYACLASEKGSEVTRLPTQTSGFEIKQHIRRQSVWALVAAAAMEAAARATRKGGKAAA